MAVGQKLSWEYTKQQISKMYVWMSVCSVLVISGYDAAPRPENTWAFIDSVAIQWQCLEVWCQPLKCNYYYVCFRSISTWILQFFQTYIKQYTLPMNNRPKRQEYRNQLTWYFRYEWRKGPSKINKETVAPSIWHRATNVLQNLGLESCSYQWEKIEEMHQIYGMSWTEHSTLGVAESPQPHRPTNARSNPNCFNQ